MHTKEENNQMKKLAVLLKKGLKIILKITKTTTNLVLELGIEAVKATPEVIKATGELAKETLSQDPVKKHKEVLTIIITTAGTITLLVLGLGVLRPLLIARYGKLP